MDVKLHLMWSQVHLPWWSMNSTATRWYQPGPAYGTDISFERLPGMETKEKSPRRPGVLGTILSRGEKMEKAWALLANALRRHRRTSISRSSPSWLASLTFQAKVGRRGLSTYAANAWGLKQDSSVRSCLDSKAVFSAWQVEHTGWKRCSAPFTVWRKGVMWSHSMSWAPSNTPPHSAHRLSYCLRSCSRSSAAGARLSAFRSFRRTSCVWAGRRFPMYSKSPGRASSQRLISDAYGGCCRILQVPFTPSLASVQM